MVLKRRAGRLVARRRETGERTEVVNEVRLIEIAGIEGNEGPIDRLPAMRARDRVLEAADSAEPFWRETDLDLESLDESFRTHADRASDPAYVRRPWSAGEGRQGIGDRGVPPRRSPEVLERGLKHVERRLGAEASTELLPSDGRTQEDQVGSNTSATSAWQ